ncbi:hypothetical protein EOE67_18165 [Rheinheimera riviphila]|uniref:TniQ domain-containing protein n=1 Tax=Rheinheimera riviphila TaxID=1834037 RepID=A0A437QFG2_9GAMM|nr:TniQ family protein [Rheinheimera riviphila]RVU33163.1 hypothetical protein EOE67_18165 [Rheinheimera riviphila]
MVVRPKIKANESLQSYMTRICRANHWRYLGFKAHVTKYVAPLNSTKLNDRKAISTFLAKKTGFSEVSKLVDVWLLVNRHRSYFDMSRIKICPICYEDGCEAPAYWSFNSYLCCVQHECLMVDSCHSCNQRYTNEGLIDLQCDYCHTPIRDNKPKQVEATDYYSRKIYDLFASKNMEPEDYLSCVTTEITQSELELTLMKSLVSNFSNDLSTSKRHARRHSAIELLYQKQLLCGTISRNERMLNAEVARAVTELYRRGESDLGRIIQTVRPLLEDPRAAFLRKALQAFILSCPPELDQLRVGVRLLEQLFCAEKGYYEALLRTNFSSDMIIAPGTPAILARSAIKLIKS